MDSRESCNVCGKTFPSRNKLFTHLKATNPSHMVERHYVSYVISCKTHPEYEYTNCINIPGDHDMPKSRRICEDVYLKKIKIVLTRYHYPQEIYYVTDFDPEDLREKMVKPRRYRNQTTLERHRAQYE
jgi:hypothetical protein